MPYIVTSLTTDFMEFKSVFPCDSGVMNTNSSPGMK